MKINSTIRVSALLMAILTLSMPVSTLSQQNLQVEAITAAERDAKNDINCGLWLLGGCLGGVVGVIVAYAVEPSPPATRLLGKSPEYVASYTDAYQEKAKKDRVTGASVGCALNALGVAVYLLSLSLQGSYI